MESHNQFLLAAYEQALMHLIESRQRHTPCLRKIAKNAARQQMGIRCAKTGQAGMAVAAVGLLFTPYAPSIALTATVLGATSITTSAVDAVGSWVIGGKLADIMEEDKLLSQLAWDAQAAIAAYQQEQERLRQIELQQQQKLLEQGDPSEGKKEKKKKAKEEKKKNKGYQVEEVTNRRNRAKGEGKKKKKKSKKEEGQELQAEREENGEAVTAVAPVWWLVPIALEDEKGKELTVDEKKKKKESKQQAKKDAAKVAATQGALFVTNKMAGKAAGLFGVATVSVSQCAKYWKSESQNQIDADQYRAYMMASIPMLQAELHRVREISNQLALTPGEHRLPPLLLQ